MLASWTAAAPASAQATFDHGTFARVLESFTDSTGVDYRALREDPVLLDRYVRELATLDESGFRALDRNGQLAYLLNAYNALAIATVVRNYPIRRALRLRALFRPRNSVWQIPGYFDGIRHRVAGHDLTLDDIEHAWIRPRYEEPRIHFALVCAARSCPRLRSEPYRADRLQRQLEHQTAQFLRDRGRNLFEAATGTVQLSSIFRWFGEDFAAFDPGADFQGSAEERRVLAFVAPHLPVPQGEWLRTGDYSVEYLDYDWSLNEITSRGRGAR